MINEFPENAKNFLSELNTLMEKYNVEIVASDEWMGYAECGEDIQIRIESDLKAFEYFSIPFGNSIDVERIKKVIS